MHSWRAILDTEHDPFIAASFNVISLQCYVTYIYIYIYMSIYIYIYIYIYMQVLSVKYPELLNHTVQLTRINFHEKA
jgi:hypothetical protein